MLLGAPAMIALMRHRGDNRGLSVRPAVNRNAGLCANGGTRAVGADHQRRRQPIAIRELDIDARG
jgi:hypothetical protein